MPNGHLGILQPVDYYGEVTGTVIMMVPRERPSNNEDQTQGGDQDQDHNEEQNEHDDGLKRTADGIVLHPQPQNDPNDPLNWPVWRRDLALTVIGFHSFIIGGQTAILAAAFTTMAADFGVSTSRLAYLVGAYMLVLGFGSVIFAPLALKYGKRPVYLIALVIWIAGSIWGGASHSFESLLGARIVMGFGGSPTEALPSASIAEIYFLHERAYRLGIYTLLLLGGKNILPMIAGFIISSLGWNWLFWIETIIVGMNLVLTFFFVPETFWDRTPVPDSRSIRETALAREARANSLLSQNSGARSARSGHTQEHYHHHQGHHQELQDPQGSQDSQEHENHENQPVTSPKSEKHPKFDLSNTNTPSKPKPEEEDDGYFANFSSHNLSASHAATPVGSAAQTPGTIPGTTPRKRMDRHPTFAEPNPGDEGDHGEPHESLDGAGATATSASVRGSSSTRPGMYDRVGDHAIQSYDTRYQRRAMSMNSAYNPKKTFVQTLRIYNGVFSKDKLWMIGLRPFVLFAYPGVLFSIVTYAMSVVWLITISEVVSDIFSKAPYDFPLTSVGLLYVATFLGGCLGSAIAGRLSDMIVRVMTRHNHGVYEPEFRLVMIIPVMVTVSMGMMGFGWSSFDQDHWIVPAIFLGFLGFGCSLGSTTAITYAVDSYKMFASEALVSLNLTKNTVGFLFSLFVPKFNHDSGPKWTYVTFGIIQIFLCMWAVPLYLYGKRIRHWTDRVEMMKFLYVDEDDYAAEEKKEKKDRKKRFGIF